MAREFLQPSPVGIKCYCRGKLVVDTRSDLGWVIEVDEIRKSSWKEIRGVQDHLGRNDLD